MTVAESWCIAMYNTLKRLRQQAGLKQEFVAFKLGVSQQAVAKWEAGKSKPTLQHLDKLAKLYGCSAKDIVEIF